MDIFYLTLGLVALGATSSMLARRRYEINKAYYEGQQIKYMEKRTVLGDNGRRYNLWFAVLVNGKTLRSNADSPTSYWYWEETGELCDDKLRIALEARVRKESWGVQV